MPVRAGNSNDERRLERKREHLEAVLEASDGPEDPGYGDIQLVYQALPSFDPEQVELEVEEWGRRLASPFFIDAMTGGPPETAEINAALARAAQAAGWGMAVGSQQAALSTPEAVSTYRVVRDVSPEGFLWANLSANVSCQQAVEAVEMIEADGLQLHLNLIQELLMPEGDRSFSEVRDRIRDIVRAVEVPVVVKEVGFGISWETARRLCRLSVAGINTAGAGGTNFAQIELGRGTEQPLANEDFLSLGLPSVLSLLETLAAVRKEPVSVIASGGIRTPLDAVKALVMGAHQVALAGPAWSILARDGEAALTRFLQRFNHDVRRLLFLIGAQTVSEARSTPYVATGRVVHWMSGRGWNWDAVLGEFKRARI